MDEITDDEEEPTRTEPDKSELSHYELIP